MNQLFRLALAAAAGYVAHRKAGDYSSTAREASVDADGRQTTVTQRFNARGRFFLGLGVAITAWFFLPMILGDDEPRRSRLSGHASRLLAGRSEPDDDGEDCGCDS